MYYELDNVLDYLGNETDRQFLFEMSGNVFSINKEDLRYGKVVYIECVTNKDASITYDRIDAISWHEDMIDITVDNKTHVFREIK